jgi:hypothetical protein
MLHETVFYYEETECLMKYTGGVTLLPKGVLSLTRSQCFKTFPISAMAHISKYCSQRDRF